jgi:iron complex transport system ATP-binding protein
VGDPKVLVISSGGSGIPAYRKLTREGIPFAAGILSENDIDYAVASILASEVVRDLLSL